MLVEMRTYRYRPHSMYDPELYRGKDEVELWRQRDPISTFMAQLIAEGNFTDNDRRELEQEVQAMVADAIAFAEAGQWEPVADLLKDVHTPVGTGKPK
jgi:pyruvate dehydrogenase E1 component alpha subunit